jgi:hypothetical protein
MKGRRIEGEKWKILHITLSEITKEKLIKRFCSTLPPFFTSTLLSFPPGRRRQK